MCRADHGSIERFAGLEIESGARKIMADAGRAGRRARQVLACEHGSNAGGPGAGAIGYAAVDIGAIITVPVAKNARVSVRIKSGVPRLAGIAGAKIARSLACASRDLLDGTLGRCDGREGNQKRNREKNTAIHLPPPINKGIVESGTISLWLQEATAGIP